MTADLCMFALADGAHRAPLQLMRSPLLLSHLFHIFVRMRQDVMDAADVSADKRECDEDDDE